MVVSLLFIFTLKLEITQTTMKTKLVLLAILFFPFLSFADETWKIGAAKTIITPDQPMFMAGYGSRKTPSEGKRTDLFAKALVLEDAKGHRGLVITLDLVGIDRIATAAICKELKEKLGFERNQIALCTSHTHSGPVVGKNLGPLHYYVLDSKQQKLIDAYAIVLQKKIVAAVGKAIESMAPARVQTGSGKATFAVNRRDNVQSKAEELRAKGTLVGPSDHDVPVLTVREPESGEIRAILFGYACHATTVGFNEWNGDYPGYAQAALEKSHPGAVALFWAGCGADQNPLPRRTVEYAEKYGAELAASVDSVIRGTMPVLKPTLSTSYEEIEAPLAKLPTRQENGEKLKSTNRFEVARAKLLQRQFEKKGELIGAYPYPIGHWKLGEQIDFVILGGEVVIDYALRLKREMTGPNTWVAGYSNDVMAYIPSLRVLKEGGYEGGGSNVYYGLPGLWDESVEDLIIKTVKGE